jgi:hypothetical protein
MSLTSTVGIAKLGTKSLRATIPEGVVAYLDLGAGDKLEWKMEIEDGKKVVKIKKLEVISKEALKITTKYIKKKQRGSAV